MEIWLWALIVILTIITVALLVKIHILQKAIKEIENAFADRLITDTNTLIDISSGDRYMRNLVNAINRQLRGLRTERHRFQQGDRELKNAVTNISHDLRTPLTAICGYLELLEGEEKSEAAIRYVDIIKNRTEILIQLTEEIFRYSVIMATGRNAVKEPVVIDGVLEECIVAFYTTINERGITPNIQMPENKVIRTLDRFYTVDTARNSTGLGLAIARTLIEQMNGTISAKYENNRLSICIHLPDAGYDITLARDGIEGYDRYPSWPSQIPRKQLSIKLDFGSLLAGIKGLDLEMGDYMMYHSFLSV